MYGPDICITLSVVGGCLLSGVPLSVLNENETMIHTIKGIWWRVGVVGEGIGNTVSLLYKHSWHGCLNIFASMGENFVCDWNLGHARDRHHAQ